ncbi:hypothetical protein Pcinc_012665 [Petrolisthes cinctipes]|uniref:Uncharacterized protein n=1 Tax=Petrolisthes cinctipes TaxID=88211 RepID=A0AAE1G489_PETCI|nr:hypothetical protein Pcinc_012665 [Petrolisthes cinctipes]
MDTRKRRKEGGVVAPTLDSLQASPKRARVHAQRKFAQGSQPNSPAPTPVKETRELRERSGSTETRSRTASQPLHPPPPPPIDLVEVPVRPTVEDFLTFLCYRGTSLLPPGLEHFNTPQLVELAADSRSQSPARDDKGKPASKKKQEGVLPDRRELSKDSVKKNLDQTTDGERSSTPPFRVTRNSPHPPLVSTVPTSTSGFHPSAKKLSKRLMVNKALILQTKAKSLRLQDRKSMVLRHSDTAVSDTATRSGRILQKYRVSATTAMARKKTRVAMLSSIRPKQKLSRILQRLGSVAVSQDSKLTRITRSQVETKEDSSNKNYKGEHNKEKMDGKAEPKTGKREEKANSEVMPNLNRPVRLVRQKVIGKKVVVKKVVRVTREATRKQDVDASSSSESITTSPSQSLPSESPEQVPLAKRLRRSTIDLTTPLTTQKKASTASHSSLPSTPPKKSPASESTSIYSQETPKQITVVSRSSSRSEQKQVAASSEQENIATDRSSSSVSTKNSSSAYATSSLQQQKSQTSPVQLIQPSSSTHSKKTNVALSSTVGKLSPASSLSPAGAAGKRTGSAKVEKSKENTPSKDTSIAISSESSIAKTDETEKPTGVRTRPTRRTKEAATAYLHKIGRKLIQGHKNGRMEDDEDYEVEEDEEDDDDDDDVEEHHQVVTGISNTKTQDKTKDKVAEFEEKKRKSTPSREVSVPELSKHSPQDGTTVESTKAAVRKSLRNISKETPTKEAEASPTSHDPSHVPAEFIRVTRRTPQQETKDEVPSNLEEGAGSGSVGLRRITRSEHKRESSGEREQKNAATFPAQDSSTNRLSKAATVCDVSISAPRSIRRTRSDADEMVKKSSHPATRRASLEVDTLLESLRQKRITRGRGEGQEAEAEESISDESETLSVNTRAMRDKRRMSNGELTTPTKPDDGEKLARVRTRRFVSESPCGSGSESIPDVSKASDVSTQDTVTDSSKGEVELKSKKSDMKCSRYKEQKEDKEEAIDEQKENVSDLSNKYILDESEKLSGPGIKSRRTVTQERKSDHASLKDGTRNSSTRKSTEKQETDGSEISTRSGSRSRSGSVGAENSNVDSNEKKLTGTVVSQGRRKPIGGRRRSSNHDEAKLNEVLESVAKVFEKDINDDHYEKIEKDFMLGNKSPEKNKGDKGPLVIDKEDTTCVTEGGNSILDDKSSNLADVAAAAEVAGSGAAEARSAAVTSAVTQSGNSTPSPNKRSTTSKKLSDVVRSLQKKQAESPTSGTVYGSEKPTFLKDLNNWNSDKLRQVSSQLVANPKSSGTSPAPISSAQSDLPLTEIAPNAQISTSDNTAKSKAPQLAPLKSTTGKLSSAKANASRPLQTKSPAIMQNFLTSDPEKTNSSPTVVSTQNISKVVHTTQSNPVAEANISAPGIQRGSLTSPKAIPLILKSGQDDHITVLPSLPVAVKPPATINVVGAGFSSQLTMSRVSQLHSGVTMSSVSSGGSVANPKPIEPPAIKTTSKQLYIAPKPAATPNPVVGAGNPPGQVSISVLSHGTPKPSPKPVQIAPKPPPVSTHIHPSAQLITPQPGHVMQAQVQTISQPMHTVQAITQPIQTMQAIPQPIQTVQTVTGMPMQAVITQAVIDPTQLVTPSSPAKIITQPIFVTSSMQTAATYSFSPQTVSHGHLPGNVSAVTRVLAPTMVGKVSAKPQPQLMTPKPPESLVTVSPATVGTSASVRPVIPLPQHVPVQPSHQTQILAVNVMPIGSPHVQSMTGQTGLIGKPPGTIPVSNNILPSVPVDVSASPATVTLPQAVVYTTSASEVPVTPETSINKTVINTNLVSQCEAPATTQQVSVLTIPVDTKTPETSVTNSKVQCPSQNLPVVSSSSSPPTVATMASTTKTAVSNTCTITPVNNASKTAVTTSIENKVDSCISTQTYRGPETTFKGGVPGNVRISELPKPVKLNEPVPIATSQFKDISLPQDKVPISVSSVTITPITEPPPPRWSSSSFSRKLGSVAKASSVCSGLPMKLSPSVSVVHHKTGNGKPASPTQPLKSDMEIITNEPCSGAEKNQFIWSQEVQKFVSDKSFDNSNANNKNENAVNSSCLPKEISDFTHSASLPKNSKETSNNYAVRKQDQNQSEAVAHQPKKDIFKGGESEEETISDKIQTVNGKDESDSEKSNDKRMTEKKKEPLLKRTLFKTKSQEDKRTGLSPIYRTKNLDVKKPSGAFSPLHESSVYAFEPEVETSLEESSPFSQRIKNIQPSPGTSPVKPNNVIKPPLQAVVKATPTTTIRSPVARSLAPIIGNRPKPGVGVAVATVTTPPQPVKKIVPSPSPSPLITKVSTSTATEVSQGPGKAGFLKANTSTSTQPQQDQGRVGVEAENKDKVAIKKNVSNTSIAIQCDMDEGKEGSISEGVRANESGTQTDGPSKFPLPPNASPFYYLPLAMAALGEKLPAQLVQQMLAKTQGLVGAAEAGMILQQAAQLAQQHQQKLQQGSPVPLSNTSAVKPIKSSGIPGLAVTPIITGMSGNPSVMPINPVRPLNKNQEVVVSSASDTPSHSIVSPVGSTTTSHNSVSTVTSTSSSSVTTVTSTSSTVHTPLSMSAPSTTTPTTSSPPTSTTPSPPATGVTTSIPATSTTTSSPTASTITSPPTSTTSSPSTITSPSITNLNINSATSTTNNKTNPPTSNKTRPPINTTTCPPTKTIISLPTSTTNTNPHNNTVTSQPHKITTSPPTSTVPSTPTTCNPHTSTATTTITTTTEKNKNNQTLHVPPHRPLPTPSPVISQETTTAATNSAGTATTRVTPKARPGGRGKDDEAGKISTEEPARRRSGRATTLAATRATESDLQEIEELRRNRRAKRVAAALAKEEGWSSSSEAPLSPQMSPDTLRGWPPPRLTSPTPSQSSEGTTSSTPSQRSNRLTTRNRRQSPANMTEVTLNPIRHTTPTATPTGSQGSGSIITAVDRTLTDPKAGYTCDNSLLTRAPSFFPSEEEFTDPLDYIEKIRPEAEQFGLCRIVPPSNFKPECRVNDDMRFTANNQYIHKMMRRWGPNVRTLIAIKRCLAKQNIELTNNPLIGCMELDLVRLYEVVEQHGGLMGVIERELWGKVADACRIPRSAQERLAKLDSIYCKYLLPYATLSKSERDQLLEEVDALHARSLSESSGAKKTSVSSSDNEEDDDDEENQDCIIKGKSTALSTFYRIARNTASQWQPDPANLEVDDRYWSLVVNGSHHVCVLSASIDTSEHGYGFPSQRTSPLARHPWNLKNLCQNPNSILRSMGTIVGVTNPTLHVGMLFSTVCWYRDPHSLPWIEYLHTGASKIWYGVAASQEDKLRAALKKIAPDFVKDSAIWLPSDTAMVPPSDLVREGVRVCRVVQDPGQFVVVFPGAFTSSICKGYLISESAFFARPQYFDRAVSSFKALRDCFEPSMFSLDRLALSVVTDPRATLDGLLRARDLALLVVAKEKMLRSQLAEIGLEASERLSTPDSHRKKKSRFIEDEEENMCEVCRQNLYVALVTNSQEEAVYCLEHAYDFLGRNPSHLEYCKLMYTYSLCELDSAIKQMDERIQLKSGKKCSPCGKKTKREHLDSFSSTSSSNL